MSLETIKNCEINHFAIETIKMKKSTTAVMAFPFVYWIIILLNAGVLDARTTGNVSIYTTFFIRYIEIIIGRAAHSTQKYENDFF